MGGYWPKYKAELIVLAVCAITLLGVAAFLTWRHFRG